MRLGQTGLRHVASLVSGLADAASARLNAQLGLFSSRLFVHHTPVGSRRVSLT